MSIRICLFALFCFLGINYVAFGESQEEIDLPIPQWIVTFYNGGQVVDVIEAESFDYKNSSSVSFVTHTGNDVVILNNCIVCRRATKEDFASLQRELTKTRNLRRLLSLKQEEMRIRQEQKEQVNIEDEINRLQQEIDAESD